MPFGSCAQETNQKILVASENKREFIVKNPSQINMIKVQFDGCVIKDIPNQLSCDFGLWVEGQKAYFVELKGKDVAQACEQILETLRFVKQHHSDELTSGIELVAAIVPSANNIPSLKQSPKYINLKKQFAYVAIKEKRLEIQI